MQTIVITVSDKIRETFLNIKKKKFKNQIIKFINIIFVVYKLGRSKKNPVFFFKKKIEK